MVIVSDDVTRYQTVLSVMIVSDSDTMRMLMGQRASEDGSN